MRFFFVRAGNEADLLDQPKVEVWAGPFSKDGAITRAGARKLLDVSGVQRALDSTARNGLYLVGSGGGVEFLVIRARDGAYQRIKLLGDWDGLPAYVDERFIWFNHASPDPKDNSVARIGLDPWPP